MNVAILIGVDKYTRPVSDLPACKNDVSLMAQLLKHTNKFNEVLDLSQFSTSAEVKTHLAQFISNHAKQQVDELFFYYTGHGDLYRDDFYYLFSDFTEARRNQTALTNSELDSMLRTLNPKLTIKVVDACHAGVTYVKEADALAKQLQASQGRFSNCYFMFSSQSSQASLQDDKLSDFTKAFIDACATFTGQEIRYRDIVDHISDAFVANTEQTPTFVIQAPCVEVFCALTDPIRKLGFGTSGAGGRSKPSSPTAIAPLVEAAKLKAREYCSKEEVQAFIQLLGANLESAKFSGELTGVFELRTLISDSYEGIPGLAPVGKWVEENGADFFAHPTYRSETYEEEVVQPYFRHMSIFEASRAEPQVKTVTRKRNVVDGFSCTAETPFKAIRITAVPKYSNLHHAIALAVFVFSKRDFTLFYNFQNVKETDWEQLAPPKPQKWSYLNIIMKDDPDAKKAASELAHRFETFLAKGTRERLGLLEVDGVGENIEKQPESAQKKDSPKAK